MSPSINKIRHYYFPNLIFQSHRYYLSNESSEPQKYPPDLSCVTLCTKEIQTTKTRLKKNYYNSKSDRRTIIFYLDIQRQSTIQYLCVKCIKSVHLEVDRTIHYGPIARSIVETRPFCKRTKLLYAFWTFRFSFAQNEGLHNPSKRCCSFTLFTITVQMNTSTTHRHRANDNNDNAHETNKKNWALKN